jgi:hypothetical protein
VGEASIAFWLSSEGDCDRAGSELPLARRVGCTEFWLRQRAFRFVPRLVTSDSNWERFGPHSSPALMHPAHFSCLSPSHTRSGGLHYAPSVLRSLSGIPKHWCLRCGPGLRHLGQGWGLEMWVLLFVLRDDTDHIYCELSQP